MMKPIFRKNMLLLSLLILLASSAASCGSPETDPGQAGGKQESGQQDYARFQTYTEKKGTSGSLPQPEGGPEKTGRLQPVSNLQLQSQYPETLVLGGPAGEKRIALTFDDGPDLRYTPAVLNILKKHGVKATFFLMGSRAAALPEMTRRIRDEGHAIGNHTYWHPKLFREPPGRVHWEVMQTERVLEEITGVRTRLFRAPYGALTPDLVEILAGLDFSVIGWSVDSEDWRELGKEEIKQKVYDQVHPGAIVLMHSGGHWKQDLSGMTRALDELIPELEQAGYEMVTIPELLNIRENLS